jgi:hypothetical protein
MLPSHISIKASQHQTTCVLLFGVFHRLVQHVNQARRAALPRKAAVASAAGSSSSSDDSSFSVISSLQRPPDQVSQGDTAAAAAAAAAGPAASSGSSSSSSSSVQGLVVRASAALVQHLKTADDVEYVFADRVITTQGELPAAAAAAAARAPTATA